MSYKQKQDFIEDLPKAIETISRQLKGIQRQLISNDERAEQADMKELKLAEQLHGRLHDRLDALCIEQRVTNVLLAELVAVQKAVITDDISHEREILRSQAYTQVIEGG